MFTPDKLAECIDELGLEHKTTSVSYIFTCPRCQKRDILYMYRQTGVFRCMKEDWSGRPEYALAELANLHVDWIRSQLYGSEWFDTSSELKLTLLDYLGGEDDPIDFEIIPEVDWPFDSSPINDKASQKAVKYLESRGIDLNTAIKYGCRAWTPKQRVLFPIKFDGRLLGYQARLMVPEQKWNEELEVYKVAPKIVSSENLPTSRMVMFADNLIGSNHAVIAEGPIDAIKLDLCGGNIATMGKAVTKGQINFIRARGIKKIYTALDHDASRSTEHLVREFSDLEVFHMRPLPGKDFGAMTFQECLQAFKNAQRAFTGQMYFYLRN